MEAKGHVEEIRRKMLSISGDPNLFTESVHQATENMSTELYPQDVDVLMTLIQIADDNEYPEGVDPSLELVITSKDITNTGAPATLLVFNNEKGFSEKNIESVCSVGCSTKIGIGFRSVFLITDEPHIFSNGYQIRFDERHSQHRNIVPEWVVKEKAMLSAIQSIYGSGAALPTTTLVLPLKPDKVRAVKDQLSSIHHEVLLFLSKIRHLSVREVNENQLNTVSAISISSEKSLDEIIGSNSYAIHLTVGSRGDIGDREYAYYMWEQKFHVKHENRVNVGTKVDDRVTITLGFPLEQRSKSEASLPGIYSFLPTEIETKFPFIIQSDFLLDSSRRNIVWDNKWNQGILDCVPDVFVNAFTTLVESTKKAPISNLQNIFQFLPVKESSHPKLKHVRDAIKAKLKNATIVPCESYPGEKLFRKPIEVGWVSPAFWSIVEKASSQGVTFSDVSSHGTYLLSPSFGIDEYIAILQFLEIQPVGSEWYAKCIKSSNLVMGVSEKVYIELLVFIEQTWGSSSVKTSIRNTPLMKYVGWDGTVKLLTLMSCTDKLLAAESGSGSDCISWLLNWNREFRCPIISGGNRDEFQLSKGRAFLPKATQEAIQSCSNKRMLMRWLKGLDVKFVSVCKYAEFLSVSVEFNPKLAVTYAHFLYTSLELNYLSINEVQYLGSKMPIVDNRMQVNVRKCRALVPSTALTSMRTNITESRKQSEYNQRLVATDAPFEEVIERGEILVPAEGSRWMELFRGNPWSHENYVELGEDYTRDVRYFGGVTVISGKDLVSFLETYAKVSDVPHLSPPNAAIPSLSDPLTKRNTFLLLDWIHNINSSWVKLPKRFLSSIKNNSWLKVSLSGCPGYGPPSESFMLDSSIGNFLQDGMMLPFHIPLVDEEFYGVKIKEYKEELQTIGVRIQNSKACKYIATLVMSLADSSQLTRDHALAILKFIEFLGKNHMSCRKFIKSIKGAKWVRTSRGDMTPSASVLFSQAWNTASEICDLPFIDQDYYGEEVLLYQKQLGLLGVAVNVDKQLVLDNLKSPSSLTRLSSEAMLLLLRCIKSLESSDERAECFLLKTNLGYRCPSECFLLNPESQWGCLLQVFGSFAILDDQFYGSSIFSMSNELKKIGVMVDFEDTIEEFPHTFKKQARQSSFTKEHVLSFLKCYRQLKNLQLKLPDQFEKCICQEKWIRTRLDDYRSPSDCILFGKDWEPFVSKVPLDHCIDDTNNFYGKEIHEYREELKELGVATDVKDGAKLWLLDSVKKQKQREMEEKKNEMVVVVDNFV